MPKIAVADEINPRSTVTLKPIDRQIAAILMDRDGTNLSATIRMALRDKARALGLPIPGLHTTNDPQTAPSSIAASR